MIISLGVSNYSLKLFRLMVHGNPVQLYSITPPLIKKVISIITIYLYMALYKEFSLTKWTFLSSLFSPPVSLYSKV